VTRKLYKIALRVTLLSISLALDSCILGLLIERISQIAVAHIPYID